MLKRLQFTLGAIFFALLIVYGGARFFKAVAWLEMESDPGWVSYPVGNSIRVVEIRNVEPAGLLRVGDELIQINGHPIKRSSDIAETFRRIDPGMPYVALIKRGSALFEISLISQSIPLVVWIIKGAASLIIPNIFLL